MYMCVYIYGLYVYVSMSIYVVCYAYICMYICDCVSMYVCMHGLYVYVSMLTYVVCYACMCMYIYVYICVYICICIYMYVCMYRWMILLRPIFQKMFHVYCKHECTRVYRQCLSSQLHQSSKHVRIYIYTYIHIHAHAYNKIRHGPLQAGEYRSHTCVMS